MINKNMGTFIQALRKEKKLTQKELAEQVLVSDKTVSKWETGYTLPDITVLLKLCNVLGVSVNELLSGQRLSKQEYNQKADETILPFSLIIALATLIIALSSINDLSTLGPYLATIILCIFYACIIKIAMIMIARE